MGLLDAPASRNAFVMGNLALLQLQSLAVGSVAGLFSFGLGVLVHPATNNMNEIALMITASMLCAAFSSFVLGSFMCGLVLVCRRYKINPGNASRTFWLLCSWTCMCTCMRRRQLTRCLTPKNIDNIACPLASSFGDLVTLVILAGCSVVLQKYLSKFTPPSPWIHSRERGIKLIYNLHIIDTALPVALLVFLLGLIPAWLVYVRRNKFVAEVVKEGWVPVFAAMVISSTAGLTLERYINDFPGMALISPVLNGLIGNIASIYASRISTSLHAGVKENYKATERTLFYVHIPIEIAFMAVIGAMGLGHIRWSVGVVLGYAVVSLLMVVIALWMAKKFTHLFWRWGYDPDNYVLPIL